VRRAARLFRFERNEAAQMQRGGVPGVRLQDGVQMRACRVVVAREKRLARLPRSAGRYLARMSFDHVLHRDKTEASNRRYVDSARGCNDCTAPPASCEVV
jgi:hypothetical protein